LHLATDPATDDQPLLRFRDVSVGYGGVAVRRHLTFTITRGDFLGVAGPNGSGKTTILRTVLNLLPPVAGHVEHVTRLSLSYVPQRTRIDTIVPITAFQVALMGRIQRLGALQRVTRHERERARDALARVGVDHLASRLFRDLSGGQQQLVLVARALAADAEMLVLDEPTTAMDLATEHSVIELIRRLHAERGLTIILVTHLLPVLLNTATTVLLLAGDRVLYGQTAEVLDEGKLSELYGIPVRIATVAGRRTLVIGDDRDA
jgi:ABC-type Mn2+/Zn2+ transport system ATPase subunit